MNEICDYIQSLGYDSLFIIDCFDESLTFSFEDQLFFIDSDLVFQMPDKNIHFTTIDQLLVFVPSLLEMYLE